MLFRLLTLYFTLLLFGESGHFAVTGGRNICSHIWGYELALILSWVLEVSTRTAKWRWQKTWKRHPWTWNGIGFVMLEEAFALRHEVKQMKSNKTTRDLIFSCSYTGYTGILVERWGWERLARIAFVPSTHCWSAAIRRSGTWVTKHSTRSGRRSVQKLLKPIILQRLTMWKANKTEEKEQPWCAVEAWCEIEIGRAWLGVYCFSWVKLVFSSSQKWTATPPSTATTKPTTRIF